MCRPPNLSDIMQHETNYSPQLLIPFTPSPPPRCGAEPWSTLFASLAGTSSPERQSLPSLKRTGACARDTKTNKAAAWGGSVKPEPVITIWSSTSDLSTGQSPSPVVGPFFLFSRYAGAVPRRRRPPRSSSLGQEAQRHPRLNVGLQFYAHRETTENFWS